MLTLYCFHLLQYRVDHHLLVLNRRNDEEGWDELAVVDAGGGFVGREHDDDGVQFREHLDVLAAEACRVKAMVAVLLLRPPEIAVAGRFGIAALALFARGRLNIIGGKQLLTVPQAIVEGEIAKFGGVARAQAQTRAAKIIAARIGFPEEAALLIGSDAERRKQKLTGELQCTHAGGLRKDHRKQVRAERGVHEELIRLRPDGVFEREANPIIGFETLVAGIAEIIRVEAARHFEQVTNGDLSLAQIAGMDEIFGRKLLPMLIEALDRALLERDADEERYDAFGHRMEQLVALAIKLLIIRFEKILLKNDHAVPDDDDGVEIGRSGIDVGADTA